MRYEGGAIYTKYNVVLTFNGTNNFFNNFILDQYNFASYGGAVYAQFNISLGQCTHPLGESGLGMRLQLKQTKMRSSSCVL